MPLHSTDLSDTFNVAEVGVLAAPCDINFSAAVCRGRVFSDFGVADGLFGGSSRALSQHSRLELCVVDVRVFILHWSSCSPGIDAVIEE